MELRDQVLRGLILFGVSLVLVTEALGALHLLSRWPVFFSWSALFLLGAWYVPKRRPIIPRFTWFESILAAGVTCIFAITLLIALVSPPNSVDALAYHMPRVIYWAQAHSVSFFPTTYFAQISMQPMAEYLMLHTYLLSGSDRFVNLGQWLGSVGCAVGVSLIAKLFGAGGRGQWIAALFSVTVPNGILQATGAKNDCVLALWLVAMCYFGIRYAQCSERADLVALAGALGLALATKGTAYLFAPAMLAGIFFSQGRPWRMAPLLAAGILLLNGPHYWRNYEFSGSPLGYDSAQGDGMFRWRNESFGWRQTVSNILRNTSEQLGARSEAWNQRVYDGVVRAHIWLGIDVNDPSTTWRWTEFAPPKNANHEANAHNRWHLLLLLLAAAAVAWRRKEWLGYTLGILLAFVLFCFYLKWQLDLSRMFLPLFVLGAPIVGVALDKLRPTVLQMIVCLFLLNNARPYLFDNWVRPWKGPNSIWTTARDRQYFNDMNQWDNRASFEQAVVAVDASGCESVGIDINHFHVEYPFQALLRERRPEVQFLHTGVNNAQGRATCAVLCMDCVGMKSTMERYQALGTPRQFGRFLVYFGNVASH